MKESTQTCARVAVPNRTSFLSKSTVSIKSRSHMSCVDTSHDRTMYPGPSHVQLNKEARHNGCALSYLCPEVVVQVLAHGERKVLGVVEGRGGRVGEDLCVMVRKGVELVHHIGTWGIGWCACMCGESSLHMCLKHLLLVRRL